MATFEEVSETFKALAPMDFELRCGGGRHTLKWDGESLLQNSHDPDAETVMTTLGANQPTCLKILEAWGDRKVLDDAPDLALRLLGSRDENEASSHIEFFLTSGRVADAYRRKHELILALWEGPKRLREVFVVGRLIEQFSKSSPSVRAHVADLIDSVLEGTFRFDSMGRSRLNQLRDLPPGFLGDFDWSIKDLLQMSRAGVLPKDPDLRRRMLREVSTVFEKGREYRTIEVEDLLKPYSKNQRKLRAALIEEGLLTAAKAKGRYIRV